jgi:hypothetical protein
LQKLYKLSDPNDIGFENFCDHASSLQDQIQILFSQLNSELSDKYTDQDFLMQQSESFQPEWMNN